jgi:fructose-1-phosphate kinase PfkB-like protein
VSQPDQSHPRRILAAGLSPAWQQIMVFDEFSPGEVNRACEVHWCGSGKVLNVGIALSRLSRGRSAAPLSSPGEVGRGEKRETDHSTLSLPSPSEGEGFQCRTLSVIGPRARAAIEPEFEELGVDCRWIEAAAETRICTTIIDRSTGRTTELVENAPLLTTDEVERFRVAFAEEAARANVFVLTGSLPPGCESRHVAESLRDSEARLGETRPLAIRGPELLAALACRPFCVKPNRDELAATLGRQLVLDDDLHAAMRELNDRGAEWVVVTQGAQAVWALHEGKAYKFQPPRIENVVNPIGSGDCLAAGIAWAIASGKEMVEAIQLGIAAACDNVGQLLPARIDPGRIAELQRRVRTEM